MASGVPASMPSLFSILVGLPTPTSRDFAATLYAVGCNRFVLFNETVVGSPLRADVSSVR